VSKEKVDMSFRAPLQPHRAVMGDDSNLPAKTALKLKPLLQKMARWVYWHGNQLLPLLMQKYRK
jgi:hypothetical protein